MRFLNRDWVGGAHDQFTLELYHSVYVRHLLDIAADLPASARVFSMLSQGTLLAGGRVVGTTRNDDRFKFVVRLAGSAEAFLELEYEGVDWDASDLEALESADKCLTEEFDVTPGELFEHRILLEPDGEAVVRFKDLKFHAEAAQDE
jgi:hypothetical protein